MLCSSIIPYGRARMLNYGMANGGFGRRDLASNLTTTIQL
jgi:hypothetical protein